MKYLYLIILISFWSCKSNNPNFQKDAANPELLHESMDELTAILIHDIFSPPVASRNYAYPSIAAYETSIQGNDKYESLAGQLQGLTPCPKPDPDVEYCFPLASTKAFLVLAKKFIFSEDSIVRKEAEIMQKYKSMGIPEDVFERSIKYGESVAQHISNWADGDNYKQSRSFPKFTINDDGSRWKPTPPAYMDAIEPHWNEIRTFVIDSASQFAPPFPTKFDMKNKQSQFYKEAMEVYDTGNDLNDERKEIASFWDCNPYKMNVTGHVMHATKKITPGGHWIGIAKIAARKAKADYIETARTYALTSLCLVDGFISCWDEKYRSNLIRPETVINEYIDPSWQPLLQTPPFPEYTSGHSVISAAASVALTKIYGDNFEFEDDTELQFGLPIRKFKSFYDASSEAAVSRLYGGIHYRPAIENGLTQGKALGNYVMEKIKSKK